VFLQCFDTVGWASRRASDLQKLTDEVFVWLSVWSVVQIVCIWSGWCHCITRPRHRKVVKNSYLFCINPIYGHESLPIAAENTEDSLLLKKEFLSFQGRPTVAALYWWGEKTKVTYVQFIQDFVYQKLFKSVHYWASYPRNHGMAF